MRWDELSDEEKLERFNEAATYCDWPDMIKSLCDMAAENQEWEQVRTLLREELTGRNDQGYRDH